MEEPQHLGRPLRVVGRYALYGKLASGGMATVHFGRLLGPAGFSRTVAIKRLHPQFSKDPEFVAMFLDEARLAARIQHPNVVATVDVVARADELFLVMDYVRGESFSRLLRASRKQSIEVSLGIVASVMSGMLQGLHAAHEVKDEHGQPLSVVHRDVSPQNVLVGADGVTRVLDFGVAKAAARAQVTRDGQMKGKLSYMAPEQLLGKGVDRRTDIFAAGIVLWEALTGKRLFDAEEASEVLRMILREELPPPSAVVPSIPREIDDVVMRALLRDPSARFPTARAFAIALEEVVPIASTREVGEWVERVAGDTLLNRENTVAEIEAVSSVSTVSIVTESSPGFTKTLDGRVPASVRQLVKELEEKGAPLIVGDPVAPNPERRIHVPRAPVTVPSVRSRPPPPPPRRGQTLMGLGEKEVRSSPAQSFDDENEKTGIFDPSKHGFDDENETTGIYDPSKHVVPGERAAKPAPPVPRAGANKRPPPRAAAVPELRKRPPRAPGVPSEVASNPSDAAIKRPESGDDSKPTASSKWPNASALLGLDEAALDSKRAPIAGFDDENEKTGIYDPTKHGFDENEKTGIYDPTKHSLVESSESSVPPAFEPTRPRNPRPPIPLPEPPAAEKEASAILAVDEAEPAFGKSNRERFGVAWLWDDPSRRVVRVALVAGVLALLGGFGVAASRSKSRRPVVIERHQTPPVIAAARPAPAAPVVVGAVHAVDPSSLPSAAPDEDDEPPTEARAAVEERARPAAATVAVAAPHPRAVTKPRVTTTHVAASEPHEKPADLAAPNASPPSPPSPIARAEATSAKEKPSAKAADQPAKPAAKEAVDCAQPYTVDATGIRRIKPECL